MKKEINWDYVCFIYKKQIMLVFILLLTFLFYKFTNINIIILMIVCFFAILFVGIKERKNDKKEV